MPLHFQYKIGCYDDLLLLHTPPCTSQYFLQLLLRISISAKLLIPHPGLAQHRDLNLPLLPASYDAVVLYLLLVPQAGWRKEEEEGEAGEG